MQLSWNATKREKKMTTTCFWWGMAGFLDFFFVFFFCFSLMFYKQKKWWTHMRIHKKGDIYITDGFPYTANKISVKKQKFWNFENWDLGLRIARIDPSRGGGMDAAQEKKWLLNRKKKRIHETDRSALSGGSHLNFIFFNICPSILVRVFCFHTVWQVRGRFFRRTIRFY